MCILKLSTSLTLSMHEMTQKVGFSKPISGNIVTTECQLDDTKLPKMLKIISKNIRLLFLNRLHDSYKDNM